jgi:hypothetical protein
MDAVWIVLGVAELAVGIGLVKLVLADRRRPPDMRQIWKRTLLVPTLVAGASVALGLWFLIRGLLG